MKTLEQKLLFTFRFDVEHPIPLTLLSLASANLSVNSGKNWSHYIIFRIEVKSAPTMISHITIKGAMTDIRPSPS